MAGSLIGVSAAQAAAPAKHMCNLETWSENLTIAPGEAVTVIVDAPPAGEECSSYTQPSRTDDIAANFTMTIPAGGTAWPWVSGNPVLPGTYVFTSKADAADGEYRIVTNNKFVFQTIRIFVETPVPGPTGKPTAVAGVNQATVSWAPPAVNPSAVSYTEVYTYVDGDYDELVCTANAPATSCVTDWLPGGEPVQFVTYTYNANGDYEDMSEPSDPVTPTGDSTPPFTFCELTEWFDSVEITLEQSLTLIVNEAPAKPTLGYCDNNTYGQISSGGGWAAIAAYFDIVTVPAGLQWPAADYLPVPAGTYVLTPKAGAVPDRFQVGTVKSAGGGDGRSQILGINVVRAVPGKTGKPVAVPGDSEATVSWSPPARNPGAVAYTEVYTYVDDSSDELVCTVEAPATSCTVTDLENGTPIQFVTYAYNIDDDYSPESDPSDPVTPGPVPPAPTPDPTTEPSATPTPTPTPTASRPALDPLDPIGNVRNPNVPAAGLPAGQSLLLVNGQPAPVTVRPNATSNAMSLVVEAPGLTMTLQGRGGENNPLGLTSQQALILQSAPTAKARRPMVQPVAESSGSGFKAGSLVKFYLLPGTYLGEIPVDTAGGYKGSVPVPPGVPAGVHTLQVNGYAPDGSVRSLSIGVLVKATGRPVRTLNASATITFNALSAALSPQAKAELRALVKRTGKDPVKVASLGFVQESGSSTNDQTLSTARARAVGAYLRAIGVTGNYTVRGDGIGGPGAADRKVTVTITYRK